MKIEEINKFKESLKKLTFIEMKDPKILGKLGDVYTLLSDLFKMRLPKGTLQEIEKENIGCLKFRNNKGEKINNGKRN